MQTVISTGEIRIVGAETEGHQVSFEILDLALNGLQKTAYVLVEAHQVDQKKRSVLRGLGWLLASIPLRFIDATLAASRAPPSNGLSGNPTALFSLRCPGLPP